jgi:hypothetical protein
MLFVSVPAPVFLPLLPDFFFLVTWMSWMFQGYRRNRHIRLFFFLPLSEDVFCRVCLSCLYHSPIREPSLFLFFFGGTGVWTQGFKLAKQTYLQPKNPVLNFINSLIKAPWNWALVAHAYNPSYPEAETRRIAIWSQPRQIVLETLSWKHSSQKEAVGVAHGAGPEFKPQYLKKKVPWHSAASKIIVPHHVLDHVLGPVVQSPVEYGMLSCHCHTLQS